MEVFYLIRWFTELNFVITACQGTEPSKDFQQDWNTYASCIVLFGHFDKVQSALLVLAKASPSKIQFFAEEDGSKELEPRLSDLKRDVGFQNCSTLGRRPLKSKRRTMERASQCRGGRTFPSHISGAISRFCS